jgi:hypothetical protein
MLFTRALLGQGNEPIAAVETVQQETARAPQKQTDGEAVSDSIEVHFQVFALQKQQEALAHAKAIFADKNAKSELWSRLDMNGNGIVSCAEIDHLVVDLSRTNQYGGFFKKLNHKPAIMRAYQWTTKREASSDGDDWVERKEFNALLKNLYFFNELWAVFEGADEGHDRRIDVEEFKHGLAEYGMDVSADVSERLFARFDADHGGQILFVEFCEHFMSLMERGAPPEAEDGSASGDCRAADRGPVADGDSPTFDGSDEEDGEDEYDSEEEEDGEQGGQGEEISPVMLLLGRGQRAKAGVEGPWRIHPSNIVKAMGDTTPVALGAPKTAHRMDTDDHTDADETQSYGITNDAGSRLLPSEALFLSHCHTESKVEGECICSSMCCECICSSLRCCDLTSACAVQELCCLSCTRAYLMHRHSRCCAMLVRAKHMGVKQRQRKKVARALSPLIKTTWFLRY